MRIDNNEMVDREKRYQYKQSLYGDGIYPEGDSFLCECQDFGPLPAIGRSMIFDGRAYTEAIGTQSTKVEYTQ